MDLGVCQYIYDQGKNHKMLALYNFNKVGDFKRVCLRRAKGTEWAQVPKY